jgi:hypothetical protein
METIARIPELPPPGVPAQVTPAAPRPGASRRRRTGFPVHSVVALAAIAVAVWFLAAWQEHERLARQRRLFRLAQQPAATARESIAK